MNKEIEFELKKKTSKKRSMAFLIVSVPVLFALDQMTKQAARQTLQGKEAFVIIKGVFELRYLENRGSAFGMMQGQRAFFLAIAAAMLVIIPYIYSKIPLTRHFSYLRFTAALFLAGAVGNAADRLVHGYVVDFFYFSLIDFPIFNVADIYVTTAAGLLAWLMIFYYKDEDFEQIKIFSR